MTHDGTLVEAGLEDYGGEAPEVGTTVDIDYAMSAPRIVRASGFDSDDAVDTAATMAGGSAAIALALVARLVTARAGVPEPAPRSRASTRTRARTCRAARLQRWATSSIAREPDWSRALADQARGCSVRGMTGHHPH